MSRDTEILIHALGLDREKREPWRNYYCASDDAPQLEALVSAGLMTRGRTINEGDRYYHATEAGVAAAKAALPRPYTRAQARYRSWLRVRDVCPDLTFIEFLRRAPEAPRD